MCILSVLMIGVLLIVGIVVLLLFVIEAYSDWKEIQKLNKEK